MHFHGVNEKHVNKFYNIMDNQNLEDHDYKLEVRHLLDCEKTCDIRTLGLSFTYTEVRTLFLLLFQKKVVVVSTRFFLKQGKLSQESRRAPPRAREYHP